jgi:hypothetical protein
MSDIVGVLDSYHLGQVLKASARKLGARCGAVSVELLSNRLTEYIGTPEEDRYSYIWRSAIEDHEQDAYREDVRGVLVDALRDATCGASSINSPDALSAVSTLLNSPYPTLVRVGIYVCGEYYGNVGSVFWACAKPSWFIDASYWHELYWLIKKAFTKFSSTERLQFLELVDRVQDERLDELRQDEWEESHRRDLLHPSFGLGDTEVDAKYQALVQRRGPVRDHPDFHFYTRAGVVGDRSPVAFDSLVMMSGEELVVFLRDFVPDNQQLDGSSYRGLASALSAAVRASEDGFSHRIGLFVDLARPYQHGLLRGLKERWSEDKRDINWSATLLLIQSIASSPSFKADLKAESTKGWEPSVGWVVSDIADLLKAAAGTERKLTVEQYKQCLEILRQVLFATTPSVAAQSSNAVSHAINSHRGRTLESFIHIALAMRREEVAANQGVVATWKEVASVFEAELASSESGNNAEFATLAGMYCANLHYLNSQWTEANFDRLFSSSNEVAWSCAAQGFAYQRYVYPWLIKKLEVGGHLRRMVYSEALPDQVAEKALQFLGLAYLDGTEPLDDGGLLSELVRELQIKQLSRLCWFFWTLRGKNDTSSRAPRILLFWLKISERLQASQVEEPGLLSDLSQLAVFIEDLTSPLVEMWASAAPHARVKHHGGVLVENLARLVCKYPKEVAVVFRSTVSSFLPDYRKEDVLQCVTGLAQAGEVDEAEWLCNAYAEGGSTMLKETYDALRAGQRTESQSGFDQI